MPNQEFSKSHEAFADELLRTGALVLDHQPSSSAPESGSPLFRLDLGRLRSFPPARDCAVWMVKDVLPQLTFHAIADASPEVSPVVSVLSYLCRIPVVSPIPTTDGQPPAGILGVVPKGDMVLILEGALRNGESTLRAIRSIEAANLRVRDLLVLLDLEEGGYRLLSDAGYIVRPALTLSALCTFYARSDRFGKSIQEAATAHLAQQSAVSQPAATGT